MRNSVKQYEARIATRRANGTQTMFDAPTVGVTFRTARTDPPPAMALDLQARANELRGQARRLLRVAAELEAAAQASK